MLSCSAVHFSSLLCAEQHLGRPRPLFAHLIIFFFFKSGTIYFAFQGIFFHSNAFVLGRPLFGSVTFGTVNYSLYSFVCGPTRWLGRTDHSDGQRQFFFIPWLGFSLFRTNEWIFISPTSRPLSSVFAVVWGCWSSILVDCFILPAAFLASLEEMYWPADTESRSQWMLAKTFSTSQKWTWGN